LFNNLVTALPKIHRTIEKKLVKFLFYKKMVHPLPAEYHYINCCEILGVDTLEKKGIFLDLETLARSIKNQLDTQSFIENLNFAVLKGDVYKLRNAIFRIFPFVTKNPINPYPSSPSFDL
jgi:hypothetical protein